MIIKAINSSYVRWFRDIFRWGLKEDIDNDKFSAFYAIPMLCQTIKIYHPIIALQPYKPGFIELLLQQEGKHLKFG